MMYLIKHKNSRSSNKLIKNIFIFLLILIFILLLNFSTSFNRPFSKVLSPFFEIGNYFYQNFFASFNFFGEKKQILARNEELSREIDNLKLALTNYEILKAENEKLYNELGFKKDSNLLSAKIVARPPQITLDSLLLNRGDADMIKINDLVLVGENFLIGKVAKVGPNQSTAVLNSFPGVVSYAFVFRTNEPIEIEGVGTGMKAKVPIDFDIQKEDKIMVAGDTSYVVAIVGSIEENESLGLKDVFMSLPVNISKTNFVFIEKVAPQ